MPKLIDETGNRYGRLTVIEKVQRKKGDKGHTKWRCRCDCGNETISDAAALRDGRIQSCGCLNKEKNVKLFTHQIPISSQFGILTVVAKAESQNKRARWLCQCECGNQIVVEGNKLLTGNTKSCGCLKKSCGEMKIKKILNKYHINFTQEQSFQNCINKEGNKLRFDFYVNKTYLIEYDGIQHFQVTGGWGTKENFERTKLNDKIKNEYCKSHNIPLIRIPYTHCNKITIDDLRPETSQFLIT